MRADRTAVRVIEDPTVNKVRPEATSQRNAIMNLAGRAALISIGGLGLRQVLRLGSNLVMARLLAPEAFGLIGLTATLTYMVWMLTDVGIVTSIVRSDRGDDTTFLRTAWVVGIVRGLLIYACIVGIALSLVALADRLPPDSILTNPVLPGFICVGALQIIAFGAQSPNLALAQRNQTVGRVVVVELLAQVFSITCMVAAALAGFGAWSLAIGMAAAGLAISTLSHLLVEGPKMRFEFDRGSFGELFHFGKWLILSSLAGALLSQGDKLIFGYLFAERPFSLYTFGGIWVGTVTGLANTLAARVVFPAIASARRRGPDDLRRTYFQMRRYGDAVAVVVALALYVVITPAIDLLFRDEYAGAAPYAQLLTLTVLFVPYSMLGSLLLSEGKSRVFAVSVALPLLFLFTAVPLAFAVKGGAAAIIVFALTQFLALPLQWYSVSRMMKLSLWVEARLLLVVALAVVVLSSTVALPAA